MSKYHAMSESDSDSENMCIDFEVSKEDISSDNKDDIEDKTHNEVNCSSGPNAPNDNSEDESKMSTSKNFERKDSCISEIQNNSLSVPRDAKKSISCNSVEGFTPSNSRSIENKNFPDFSKGNISPSTPSGISSNNGEVNSPSTSRGIKRTISSDSESEDDTNNEEKESHSSSSDGECGDNTCSICLGKYRGEVGNPDICHHIYCLDCILTWSERTATCPQDRLPYTQIKVRRSRHEDTHYKVVEVETAKKNEPVLEDEIMIILDDNTYCEICRRCDREDELLLCDGCDLGYHLHCLNPPLSTVPTEEWFCDTCSSVPNNTAHRPANIAAAINRAINGRRPVAVQSSSTSRNTDAIAAAISRRILPRTQQVVRVRKKIKAIRKKKKKQRRRAKKSRRTTNHDDCSDDEVAGKKNKTYFDRPEFSVTGFVGDDDIDAMFNEDKYADDLLKKDFEEERRRERCDPRELLHLPDPNYSGRVSDALTARVESSIASGPIDLLGDILDDQSVLLTSSKYLNLDENRKLTVPDEHKKNTADLFNDDGLEYMKIPLPSQQEEIDKKEREEKKKLEEENRLKEEELLRKQEQKEREEEMIAKLRRDKEIEKNKEKSRNDRFSSYNSGYSGRQFNNYDNNHYRSSRYDGGRSGGHHSRDDRRNSKHERDRSDSRNRQDKHSKSDTRNRHESDKNSHSRDKHGSNYDRNGSRSHRNDAEANGYHNSRHHSSSSSSSSGKSHSRRDRSHDDKSRGKDKLFFGHSKYENKGQIKGASVALEVKESKAKTESLVTMSIPTDLFSNKTTKISSSKPYSKIDEKHHTERPVTPNACNNNMMGVEKDSDDQKRNKNSSSKDETKNKMKTECKEVVKKDRLKSLFGDDSFEDTTTTKDPLNENLIKKTDNKDLIKSSSKSSHYSNKKQNDSLEKSVKSSKITESENKSPEQKYLKTEKKLKSTKSDVNNDVKKITNTNISFEDSLFMNMDTKKITKPKRKSTDEKEPIKTEHKIKSNEKTRENRDGEKSEEKYSKYKIKAKSKKENEERSSTPCNEISNRLDLLFGSIDDITDSSNSNTPSTNGFRHKSKSRTPISDNVSIPSPFSSYSYDFHKFPQFANTEELVDTFSTENKSIFELSKPSRGRFSSPVVKESAEDSLSSVKLPVFVVVPTKSSKDDEPSVTDKLTVPVKDKPTEVVTSESKTNLKSHSSIKPANAEDKHRTSSSRDKKLEPDFKSSISIRDKGSREQKIETEKDVKCINSEPPSVKSGTSSKDKKMSSSRVKIAPDSKSRSSNRDKGTGEQKNETEKDITNIDKSINTKPLLVKTITSSADIKETFKMEESKLVDKPKSVDKSKSCKTEVSTAIVLKEENCSNADNKLCESSDAEQKVTTVNKSHSTEVPKDKTLENINLKNNTSRKIPLEKNALVVVIKNYLDPHYQNQEVSKENYKEIIAKCLSKILNSNPIDKSTEVHKDKIKQLVEGYVTVYKHRAKKK